jgi:nitroreductase
MDDFIYDKKIFLSKMCPRNTNLMTISKDQLISKLTIYYHSIEKGLSLPSPTYNFGFKSNILNMIYKMTNIFVSRFGNDHQIIKSIYHTLSEYKTYHIKNNIKIECKSLVPFLEKYKHLEDSIKTGGTTLVSSQTEIPDNFFLQRRSVRNFNHKPIQINIIKNIINNSVYGTPTVCNRPINKIKCITTKDKILQLLRLQAGNLGFRENIPMLLIITADLEYYENIKERRSPYIGAGMFAQSIVYALHAKNIGSCCLNWDTSHTNDIEAKKILNITKETIIMFIAIGYYDTNTKVAFSMKPSLDDVLRIY